MLDNKILTVRTEVRRGGGGEEGTYSCSQTVKTIDFEKIDDAEHEYVNMFPPSIIDPQAIFTKMSYI